jgi:hypothetical protein
MEKYRVNIYKIWWDDIPHEIYVGRTTQTLSQRMTNHRNACPNGTSRIYIIMRERGVDTFKYVLLSSKMVCNNDEARQFEQLWIEKLMPILNQRMECKSNEIISRVFKKRRRPIRASQIALNKREEEAYYKYIN